LRFTRPCCSASLISLRRKSISAFLYQRIVEKHDEASDLALKAHETLPEDSELAQLLAKLSYERNEFATSFQLLQESAASGPLDAEHLYYLGMAHSKENNTLQARRVLDQALAAGLHDPLASDARRTLNALNQTN
jgi:Flp pilus assembly protein TadD